MMTKKNHRKGGLLVRPERGSTVPLSMASSLDTQDKERRYQGKAKKRKLSHKKKKGREGMRPTGTAAERMNKWVYTIQD